MSKASDPLETAVSVQEWQKNYPHDASKPEGSVTTRLCDRVLDVFREALVQLAQPNHAETAPKPVRISLERTRGLIALWSDGYGIQDGRLDDLLAKSRNIRRSTLKTLSSIANTLLGRLIPLAKISSDKLSILTVQLVATVDEASYMIHDVTHGEGDDRSDTSSDGCSDLGADDSITEVAEDLKTDAQCLMDLDPLFRDPVLDLASHKQKQNREAIDWTPETVFCDKVQRRFPRAEPDLVETLGKANWARFLRCQETRNAVETGTLTETNPAGEDGTVAASSKYHDSGLGTSLPTASSYAETVMTYAAGNGQKVRIPPLSDEAKKGVPFPCLACGRSVRITNNSGWKRHLYLDLQPYLCLESLCSELCFGTRADWIAHLALDHGCDPAWDAITCPLCSETTEKGKLALTTHLARHLEEISLSALPAYPDEDDDEAFETDSDVTSESSGAKAAEDEEPNLGKADLGAIPTVASRTRQGNTKSGTMRRYGFSNRWSVSPFGAQDRAPDVRDEDFSYITLADLDDRGRDIPRPYTSQSHMHDLDPPSAPSQAYVGRHQPEDDVILIQHKGCTYHEYFPAHSIGDGKLLVADVRERVTMILDLSNHQAKRIKLFYKGRRLKKDDIPVRDYGVKHHSELLMILGEPSHNERFGRIRCLCRAEDPTPMVVHFASDADASKSGLLQCDKCKCWQHRSCVGLQPFSMVPLPDKYDCEKCRPDYHSISQNKDGYVMLSCPPVEVAI